MGLQRLLQGQEGQPIPQQDREVPTPGHWAHQSSPAPRIGAQLGSCQLGKGCRGLLQNLWLHPAQGEGTQPALSRPEADWAGKGPKSWKTPNHKGAICWEALEVVGKTRWRNHLACAGGGAFNQHGDEPPYQLLGSHEEEALDEEQEAADFVQFVS